MFIVGNPFLSVLGIHFYRLGIHSYRWGIHFYGSWGTLLGAAGWFRALRDAAGRCCALLGAAWALSGRCQAQLGRQAAPVGFPRRLICGISKPWAPNCSRRLPRIFSEGAFGVFCGLGWNLLQETVRRRIENISWPWMPFDRPRREIHGFQWKSMEIHGNQHTSMEIQSNQWKIHRHLQKPIETNRNPQKSVEMHRNL